MRMDMDFDLQMDMHMHMPLHIRDGFPALLLQKSTETKRHERKGAPPHDGNQAPRAPLDEDMLAAALVSGLLVTAYVLPPVALTNVQCRSMPVRAAVVRAQSLYANDGGDSEVDWDKEAAALTKEAAALATPANPFFKAVKAIPVPDLINEFADSAPPDVQDAVRFTIAKLLGSLPSEVADITRVTSDKNIASLMFSMQMTGYLFRNAEYRRSLSDSLTAAEGDGAVQAALPAVSGTVSVEIAEGMKAEVDAAAYMAELRSEVEGLRAQLTVRRTRPTAG